MKEAGMRGSCYRCVLLAAALAVALAVPGCKRDYKAPEPKTQATASSSIPGPVLR